MKRFQKLAAVTFAVSPVLLAGPLLGQQAVAVPRPVSRPPVSAVAPVRLRASTAEAAVTRGPSKTAPAMPAVQVDGNGLSAATGSAGAGRSQAGTAQAASGAAAVGSNLRVVHAAARSGHRIVLFRRAQCVPCDRITAALGAAQGANPNPEAALEIVVADGGDNAVAGLRTRFAALGNAVWTADADGRFAAALKPRGTPMIYALDGDRIVWSMPGNLDGADAVARRSVQWMAEASSTTDPGGTAHPVVPGSPAVPGGAL